MTTTDRDQLQNILDLLDELLDSDTLDQEEWHRINGAYHTLEGVLDEQEG